MNLLRLLRVKGDLTQEEVANLMGVSYRTYWNWENGKTEPRSTEMERLLKVLEKASKSGSKK